MIGSLEVVKPSSDKGQLSRIKKLPKGKVAFARIVSIALEQSYQRVEKAVGGFRVHQFRRHVRGQVIVQADRRQERESIIAVAAFEWRQRRPCTSGQDLVEVFNRVGVDHRVRRGGNRFRWEES